VGEALVVSNLGGGDGGYFHCLESLQCMTERRRGGETGVAWVHATAGEAVWLGFGRIVVSEIEIPIMLANMV
jgi:hypothetical protein